MFVPKGPIDNKWVICISFGNTSHRQVYNI